MLHSLKCTFILTKNYIPQGKYKRTNWIYWAIEIKRKAKEFINFRLFVGLEGSYNIRWGYKPTLCTINDSLNWNLRLEVESIVAWWAKEILVGKYMWIK